MWHRAFPECPLGFHPLERMKIPFGSGAQAPSPAFGPGSARLCRESPSHAAEGRCDPWFLKCFRDFRQSEVEGHSACAEAFNTAGMPVPHAPGHMIES